MYMDIILNAFYFAVIVWTLTSQFMAITNGKYDKYICIKCLSFWSTLIVIGISTLNPITSICTAATSAFIAHIIDSKLSDTNL